MSSPSTTPTSRPSPRAAGLGVSLEPSHGEYYARDTASSEHAASAAPAVADDQPTSSRKRMRKTMVPAACTMCETESIFETDEADQSAVCTNCGAILELSFVHFQLPKQAWYFVRPMDSMLLATSPPTTGHTSPILGACLTLPSTPSHAYTNVGAHAVGESGELAVAVLARALVHFFRLHIASVTLPTSMSRGTAAHWEFSHERE